MYADNDVELADREVELTVLMPCLDEAETVAACVTKALSFLTDHDIDGEVVVADNGSTDGSQRLAEAAGARVVSVQERGYGCVLRGGIRAARGKYVIMGDSDDSYDFAALMPFIDRLRTGADLVMGNRFRGGIEPGAMPALHRYLGNPVLSLVARRFFQIPIGDFHCGLRGFRRDSALSVGLQSSGMEFASEMVVRAALAGQRVEEVPTTLSRDGRSRPPHLRRWRDGWRHLKFLLLFCPRWLFLIPGAALFAAGMIIGSAVIPDPLRLDGITFDLNTLEVASGMVVIGFQAVLCALFAQVYASTVGFLPEDPKVTRVLAAWSLERGLWLAGVLALSGLTGLVVSFTHWHSTGFGYLDYDRTLRVVTLSVTALVMSCQVILGTFFLAVLRIPRPAQPVPADGTSTPAVAGQPGPRANGAAQPGPLPNGKAGTAVTRDFSPEQDGVRQRLTFPVNGRATH